MAIMRRPSATAVNRGGKLAWQRTKLLLLSSTTTTLVLLCFALVLLGEAPTAVRGLEMEMMRDGCLQVTLKVRPLLLVTRILL